MARSKSADVAPSMPEDYRAEDDHRTLTRAEEIRRDTKRFNGARKHARKQVRNISRLYGRNTAR